MKRRPTTGSALSRPAMRLLAVFLAAGFFTPQVSRAQVVDVVPVGEDDGTTSSTVATGYYDQGQDIFFRLHHHSEHYGEAAGKSAFGVTKYFVDESSSLFLDAAYRLDNNAHSSASAGVGLRTLGSGWLGGNARISGAYLWYDGDHSDQDNYFHQFGFGFESLGEKWDLRANAYLPFGDRVKAGRRVLGGVGTLAFTENFLTQDVHVLTDYAMRVYDAEVAYHLGPYPCLNLWAFGGAYHLDGGGEQATGLKTGVRGYVAEDLSMQLTVAHDDVFGTIVAAGFNWYFNHSTPGHTRMSPACIIDRLRAPVRRNDYVMIMQRWVDHTERLTDPDGNDLFFVHVNSGAGAGGDGTVETPFSTLAGVQANSSPGDIVLAHSNSLFNGESLALQDDQRLLGEGVTGGHTVATAEFGDVTLPESSPGAAAGAVPIVQNAPGDAVSLANNNEISGVTVDGGTRGIVGAGTHSSVNVNRTTVRNTTGNGIDVNSTGSPTFDQLTFDNVGGDDLVLHDKNVTNTKTTTISNLLSNNPQGIGLNVEDNKGTLNIDEYTYNGGAAGAGGMLFTSATASVNVGNASINNGAGFGVRINGGSATHTFTDTTITDTTGAAFQVDGGAALVSFTGKITQSNNAAAVAVSGGHTGTVTLQEATAGAGIVDATNGTGLQFNNADGVYQFNHAVTLNGGDAGIDVIGGSGGTFTFSDATITNPTGTALNVVGGTATVNFTGKITQANNAAAVNVSGGHSGTINVTEATAGDGIVAATNGTGLQFNNADGVYNFNHAVTLDDTVAGSDAGIDIINDSTGTFTFSNATITNPTGTALKIAGGTAMVNFTGKITQANNARAVAVSNGHSGTINLQEVTAGDGIVSATDGTGLHFDNADGVYNFNHAVSLNGGDAGINIINGSNGTFTFSNATITNPTGAAFYLSGGTASVNFTGKVTQNNNAAAVDVSTGHIGTITFQEASAGDGIVAATGGTGLQFNNADGIYQFNHAVTLSGGSAGIDILGGSDGTFTFSDATITDRLPAPLQVNGGTASVTYVGDITQGWNVSAVAVSGGHSGSISFSGGQVSATNGGGLQFNNADGSYTFSDVALSGGAGIDVFGGSDGTFTFNSGSITGAPGTAVDVNGGSPNLNFNATIANTAGRSVEISSIAGGSLNFTNTITDSGQGVLVSNNTGGTVTFTGLLDLDTTTNDAVTLANNTGATIRFSQLDINTTSGQGLVASGGGTLEVAGSNNTINTTTGTGLNLNGVTIGGSGASFKSISVAGATNGILLDTVDGGTITVGSGGSIAGDGGYLKNTTGHAVSITNAENVSLNYLIIFNAGGDGVHVERNGPDPSTVTVNSSNIINPGGRGIDLDATGSGKMELNATSNIITGTGQENIRLRINDSADVVDLTLSQNFLVNSAGEEALLFEGLGAGLKTVNMLVDNNSLTNDSATASTADIDVDDAVRLNATVTSNSFVNNGAGPQYQTESKNAATWIRLNLNGNSANAGAGNFDLTNTAGTFSVLDLPNVNANNTGTVITTGTILNDPGPIPTP